MTREDEVQGKKVSTGGWHGTELELMQLLTRRSIGYELAGLCPFDTLQVVTTRYINELSRSPLSGYARVSFEQVERADRALFRLAAEKTAGGLSRLPDMTFPLEEALKEAVAETEFCYLLMQMPAGRGSSGGGGGGGATAAAGGGGKAAAVATSAAAAGGGGAGGQPKSVQKAGTKKGSGKGYQTIRVTPVTKLAICFAFNQKWGCKATNVADGQSCPRGKHTCWVKGCGVDHSAAKNH